MEWEIPEPLSIRPCQKPSEFKARQLRLYPVRLRKLPQWVDKANYEVISHKQDKREQNLNNVRQNSGEADSVLSLGVKYKNKTKYKLIYDRGEENYVFNPNFAYEYIPINYCDLDQYQKCQSNGTTESFSDDQGQIQPKKSGVKEFVEFDSKFECGNLSKVYRVNNQNEYHLFMQNDINTLGYNQWFAFSVKNNLSQQCKISFRIVNFVKPNSMYKKGMKPWYICQKTPVWKQIPDQCVYRRTNVKNTEGDYLYELNFTIKLTHGLTFIAMMPLYSYSRLCRKIQNWKTCKGMRLYHKKVYSLTNNIVPILEYVANADEEDEQIQDEIKWYDTVVVFARTHPGEVWSSFLIQELIETTINFHKSKNGKFRYLFFPMINTDGVVYGNFRCDFSGVDLNRVWIEPSKFTQCSIFSIKKILNKQFEHKKAKYFIDLHSHSKKYNIFAFTSAQSVLESRLLSDIIRLSDENKVFDPIISQKALSRQFLTESQTTYLSCKDIQFSRKKSTARAFMTRLTQRGKSMTVEISFYGYEDKNEQNQIKVFTSRDFNDFAWSLIKKLHDCINSKEEITLVKKILQNIYTNYTNTMSHHEIYFVNTNSLKKQPKFVDQNNQMSQDSDSEPEKYYTNQTKKIIKNKNGELFDSKVYWNMNIRRRGYLKQTESTIKKIQDYRKQKNNSHLGHENRKKNIQSKNQNNSATKREQIHKKISFSQHSLKNQRTEQKNSQQLNKKSPLNDEKIEINKSISEKAKFLKKKFNIQSRKYEPKSQKQKKSQSPLLKSQSRHLQQKVENLVNSVFQPIILEVENTKKYEPIFGQFLTKNKRTSSRRYKTVTKQQFNMYKKQLEKTNFEKQKKNETKQAKSNHETSTFLQDKMYFNELNEPKTQTKVVKREETNFDQYQARNCKKTVQLVRKKSKKRYDLDRIHNFKNIYMVERKKIIEMMKKETRFYNQVQKQSISKGDIEEIIQKRKRVRTQYDEPKNTFEDDNIFQHQKLIKVKNRLDYFPEEPNIMIKRQFSSKKQKKMN